MTKLERDVARVFLGHDPSEEELRQIERAQKAVEGVLASLPPGTPPEAIIEGLGRVLVAKCSPEKLRAVADVYAREAKP